MGARTKLVAALALCGLAAPSYAIDTGMEFTVQYVGTYGDGRIYVDVSGEIPEVGCANDRFVIAPNNPVLKQVLAVATSALITGRKVVVRTNGCYGASPTLDGTTNSYFHMY